MIFPVLAQYLNEILKKLNVKLQPGYCNTDGVHLGRVLGDGKASQARVVL